MLKLFVTSAFTGLACGLFSIFAGNFPIIGGHGIIVWVAFATTTAYFATGCKGIAGVFQTLALNLSGMALAVFSMVLSNMFAGDSTTLQVIFSSLGTFGMCMLGGFDYLSFVPGMFMGSYPTFGAYAAGYTWPIIAVSFVAGSLLGIFADKGGQWLYGVISKEK